MGTTFDHLERCGDLSQEDLETAVESREGCAALLARMSAISAPGTGVPAVLTLCAALASEACGWLDGELVIDLEEGDDTTTMRVLTDLGSGMREKVFRNPFVFRVALSEIESAIERTPGLLGSLAMRRISWKRISLGATEDVRRSTMPPRIGASDESTWLLDKLAGDKKREEEEKKRSESPGANVDEGWD